MEAVSSESSPPPSSIDDGLYAGPELIHKSRNSNISKLTLTQKPKLAFPPSHSPIWGEINKELDSGLPTVFNATVIRKHDITALSEKFDSWLYGFFLDHFGEEVRSENPPKPSPGKKLHHRGLEKLRRRKTDCKKARKALHKAGHAGTPEDKLLTQRWFALVRDHSRLRRAVAKRTQARESAACECRFKKNPHEFASKLFNPPGTNGSPAFSGEEAQEYFCKTYGDTGRGHEYLPFPESERPALPESTFSGRCPSRAELSRAVRFKRNGAAPGLNSLTYVPYKRCPAIIDTLWKMGQKIWSTQEVPADWAVAYIVLLSKSENLSSPSEFRPIAITSTAGKIFFSVLSDRLQRYMVRNNFIRREVQKGFLSGMPGCLEHSFALAEALRDASFNQRQIVITWIDLANAYGSVRHNLIQYALNWYHVPILVQKLIFNYYEKLAATVVTREWSTGFFLFDIGLFQGCVLSTILFDCVFQLLLDFLVPINHLAYKSKLLDSAALSKAYADDLALITSSSKGNQTACDYVNKWLSWTVTMAAKPKKCVSFGLRKFDPRTESSCFVPLTDKVYTAFDPLLVIDNQPIRSIADVSASSFKDTHFKFLGRWFSRDLTETEIRGRVQAAFLEDIKLIQNSKVNGLMKLWLYQFYALAHLSWPFMVHDFAKSFSVELQKLVSVTLKRWAGLYKSADVGTLYRSRKAFGMGLTSVTSHFERMQIIKCSLLKHSSDTVISSMYNRMEEREAKFVKRWCPTKVLSAAESETKLRLLFPTQDGRAGLGAGNFNASPTSSEQRKLVISTVVGWSDEEHIAHASSLALQGTWTKWSEQARPFDFSWKNLIYGPGPHLIRFVLNSLINCVKTPDMLQLWGYTPTAFCSLCGNDKCTLHHILVNCNCALVGGRYTWRHDSVLSTMEPVLKAHLSSLKNEKDGGPPPIEKSFVRKGDNLARPAKLAPRKSLLSGSTDWKLLVDYSDRPIVFPPEILATSQRPDIVIWSIALKKVVMIELTCPAEEGIEAARERKLGRYTQLKQDIEEVGWTAGLLTVEVGARGYVAYSTERCFRQLGMQKRKVSSLCKSLSRVVARCSYAIYLSRKNKDWDKNRELLADADVPRQTDQDQTTT